MIPIKITDLYDLNETIAKDYLSGFEYPWEALSGISDYIKELGKTLDDEIYYRRGEDIWIARSAEIAPTAALNGPLIIDEKATVRHCAFIRGSAIIGKNSVVGNSTELKNVILFNNVEAPHYNYVGDSILGFHAHMGAGSITSNIKADRKNIIIKNEEQMIETGLRKIGAMLGDYAEIGCNAVMNPGSIIGKHSNIYPVTMIRGIVPADSIVKNTGEVIKKI